ncbi:MAG: CvpA family protein [Proteobacteria bacterium]|nr:CvpA family protein [Pseudomonadota bacterium]MBU4297889.1 CvpA family protein [Pseudomonadota bacterium]MCG2746009.1 CvpA family protein [Desulfobulbaceae bacterium]
MSILDAVIIITIVIFLARGIWIGFVRQIASIAALIIGFVVAGRFYGESANFVIPFINNQQAGFFIAYIFLFVVAFATVILLGFICKKIMSISLLGWFDRLLGALLGLAKGSFVSCLLFMGLALFISGSSPIFCQSFFFPYLENGSKIILSIVKDKELRDNLLPKQPAISSFMDNTIDFGKKIKRQAE